MANSLSTDTHNNSSLFMANSLNTDSSLFMANSLNTDSSLCTASNHLNKFRSKART